MVSWQITDPVATFPITMFRPISPPKNLIYLFFNTFSGSVS